MPSLSIGAALLVLGNSEGLPWVSMTWQGLTKVLGMPWYTEPGAALDAPAPHVPRWTTRVAESVKAYGMNLWLARDTAEQVQYSARGFTDNDRAGRTAWNKWVQENWSKKWRMNHLIDEVFAEYKCSPYDALARGKTRKLPSLEDAQVLHLVTMPLAHALFGESAYQDDDANFLVPAIKNFVDTVIVQTWHRYRKGISREAKQREKDQAALEEEWQAITQNGASPSVKMIKSYLARLRRVLTHLTRYHDQKSMEELQDQQRTIEAMLAAAQNDKSKKDETDKLPKVLRDALQKLASEQDVRDIEQLLCMALENVNSEDAGTRVELPEGPNIDFPWKEGTEELSEVSEEELWMNLGLKDMKALPFFQRYTDPDGMIDSWSEEGEKWLSSEASTREVLCPRWHQLVGIYRMLERAFEGEPVLLMDGVGIGKTFQVIGFIACLAFYRHFFEKNSKFPGVFANKKWQGQEGNIPSQPFIIICPVNLHNQWTREIERFLNRGSFDLFPYVGKLGGRRSWWNDIFTKSHHDPCHRIVLATESALQDDASAIFIDTIRNVDDEPKKAPAYTTRVQTTLYGHKYLAMIIDEAQVTRKFNKLHTAAYALHSQSAIIIAMTATPVMTKLQDLWIMGHVMGIRPFFNKSKYDDMTKDLNRAQARDRRAERDSDEASDHLRAILSGQDIHDARKTEFYPKLQKYIPWIRETFSKHVIRRTLHSVDYLGNKIFDMPPYHEHVMLIELRQWEKQALTALTDEIAQDTLTTLVGAGKNFYIEFRRGLLHPHMNPRANTPNWKKPESLSKWQNIASTKLEILAGIVRHHLNQDNAPPLKVPEDGQSLQVDGSYRLNQVHHPECDRIVIFSAFPSSNMAIHDILALYGIKTVELHGKTTHKLRKSVLNQFRFSTRDAGPRVLILSMVGTVGLNLACANVMVIADTLWSALDDEQLRGRIYRFPQQKQVHFYRLVARGTPDVFLNNLAFDKGMLHLAFIGVDDKTLSLFNGEHNPGLYTSDNDLIDSDPEEPKHASGIRQKRIAPTSPTESDQVPAKTKKPRRLNPPATVATAATSSNTKGKGKQPPEPSIQPVMSIPTMSTTPTGSFTIPAPIPAPVTSTPFAPAPTLALGFKIGADVEVNWGTDEDLSSELFGPDLEQVEEHAALRSSGDAGSSPVPQLSDLELSRSMANSYFTTLPPSLLPSSPTHSDHAMSDHIVATSVVPRRLPHTSTRAPESSDSRHHPRIEEVGGVPLIPGGLGRFKSSSRGHGKGKKK